MCVKYQISINAEHILHMQMPRSFLLFIASKLLKKCTRITWFSIIVEFETVFFDCFHVYLITQLLLLLSLYLLVLNTIEINYR